MQKETEDDRRLREYLEALDGSDDEIIKMLEAQGLPIFGESAGKVVKR